MSQTTHPVLPEGGAESAPGPPAVRVPTDDDKFLFVVRPQPAWRAVDLLELWRYRELLYFLAWRDVKVRYKQTVLGAGWAVLQPVLTMAVFTVFFGRLGGMDEQSDAPYPIFVYAALLPWQFFATSVTQGGQSLVASANLISKVYFPRLVVPVAAIGAGLVDFAISFAVMAGLMAYYAIVPTAQLLLLPLLVLGTLVTAVGVGSLLSALTVAYRDFRYVVPFLVQIWMFASPVAYSFDSVPERWRPACALNPMAGIIAGYRSALLGGPVPWDCLAVSLAAGTGSLLLGVVYFRRVERRFADIV